MVCACCSYSLLKDVTSRRSYSAMSRLLFSFEKTLGLLRPIYPCRNLGKVEMMKDHTLYGDMASPPVRFVLITASVLGTKFQFQNIDLFKAENKSDSYKQINFLQKVPALKVGDKTICDSHAIAMYLCQQIKDQELYPNDDIISKAKIDEMLFFNATTLFPAESAIYNNFFSGKLPASDANLLANWFTALDYLEHRLSQHEWISGDKIFLSDICCAMSVSSLTVIIPIPDKYKKVKNWMDKLGKLPSFEINKQGIDRLRFFVESIKNNKMQI